MTYQALPVRQALPFASVPDPGMLLSTPSFGGFFVLPAASQFPEETRFLCLSFQQAQGKLDIVMMHRDSKHGTPLWGIGWEVQHACRHVRKQCMRGCHTHRWEPSTATNAVRPHGERPRAGHPKIGPHAALLH
jgi:hypothetical protein